MKRIVSILLALGATALLFPAPSEAKVKIVTTLSTFADLAKRIGGEHVEVSSIASPKFNPHFIEPKPSDVLKVKRADLFVHAGLDLELWRYPLVDAAGNAGVRPGGSRELDLSEGVPLLNVPTRQPTRAEGDIHLYGNPHYWHHPENVKKMAEHIAEKLSILDPPRATEYQNNLRRFLTALEGRMAEWQREVAAIQGKEIVAYHDEWPYLAAFTGVRIGQFLEPKPGIPPTPKQTQFIESYIKEREIPVIVQPSFWPRRTSDAVASRTGAEVALLCQNVGELEGCPDIFSLFEYNIQQMTEAVK